ncbi:MAG: OmpH family outer membrane protein [Caulobacteraceae bacterium]|nr:OmpH family outer membrane protein [Caulobacteraceae bacterium]
MTVRFAQTALVLALALATAEPAAAAAVTAPSPPSAAAPPTAAAATPALGGPVIPGLCLLSQETVFARSKVGVAANERLRQLAEKVQDELNAERSAIETEGRALEGKRATLSAADFLTQEQALARRAQSYQTMVRDRARQIEATRAKVVARIAAEAQPIAADAYRSRGCGLLMSRDVALAGNMANDLTATVVGGLDSKITAISFDLEPPSIAAESIPGVGG